MAGNGNKSVSHLGFFVAMLVLAGVGCGAYWYLNSTVITTIDEAQAAEQNPGLTQLHKKKIEGAKVAKVESKRSANASDVSADGK